MEVHVLIYENRHGTDVSAHSGVEAALCSAAGIARQWWAEARALDDSLPADPPRDDGEAVTLYFQALEGIEFHQIVACEVDSESAGGERSALIPR